MRDIHCIQSVSLLLFTQKDQGNVSRKGGKSSAYTKTLYLKDHKQAIIH